MSSPIKAWREQKKIAVTLGVKGKIISYTMVRVPPLGFSSDAPYIVAVVETDDLPAGGHGKKRLIGQLVDCADKKVATGMKIETIYRRQKRPDAEGVIYYGLKFRLV